MRISCEVTSHGLSNVAEKEAGNGKTNVRAVIYASTERSDLRRGCFAHAVTVLAK